MKAVTELLLEDYIDKSVKQQDEFILSVYKKQPGFVSYEESKQFIGLNKMYCESEHLGDDYLFKGNVILTIYPTEFKEENGRYNITFKYREH